MEKATRGEVFIGGMGSGEGKKSNPSDIDGFGILCLYLTFLQRVLEELLGNYTFCQEELIFYFVHH